MTLPAIVVVVASNQGGLGALLAIPLMLVWGVCAPIALLAAGGCVLWNLAVGRLGTFGALVQGGVVLANLGVVLMALPLAFFLIGAPGVGILVAALCSALASPAASLVVVGTGVRAMRAGAAEAG